MKKYCVSWSETTTFTTEVEVEDGATRDDIIYEAERKRDHGDVGLAEPYDREMENVFIERVGDA